jgi:TolB protein
VLKRLILTALCVTVCACPALAQLEIEIVGGGAHQIPIAIYPFANEASLPTVTSTIVTADLQRSGRFHLLETGNPNPLPADMSQVNFSDWRGRQADAVAIGGVTQAGTGRFEVWFRLFDVIKQEQIAGIAFTASAPQLRATAHRIADAIYEKLTGDRGVFSTRIAYVVKHGNRFELQVSDADGFGATAVLISNEPVLSPVWSPDGSRIAYVSLQNKKPVVYIQRLDANRQMTLANFRGSNSAPAWTPDGQRLAVVLTRDGGSQLYMINADGSGVRRLTNSDAIDTEPTFSGDGQWLYFTSDRGGTPQIYRMPAAGGDAQRLTFDGSYNVSPRVSPDGKTLIYVARNDDGQFHVTAMDLGSRQTQALTDTTLDESPSFAPNGKLILYATEVNGRGTLAAVSIDGSVRQRLSIPASDVREPAWGPYVN